MVSSAELESIDDCICRLSEVQTSIEYYLVKMNEDERSNYSISEMQDMLLDFHSILTRDAK
jgi:hypothetical protein